MMSDNQRRTFCRMFFLLACALPTSTVGYWIFHPQTANGWELELQARLGVEASVDFIETPGPYVTILHGLKFSDNDGKVLFKTVRAQIEMGTDCNQVFFPDKVHELTNDGLAFLMNRFGEKLIRKQSTEKPWKLFFLENTDIKKVVVVDEPETIQGIRIPQPHAQRLIGPSITLSDLRFFVGPTMPEAVGMRAVANFNIVEPYGEKNSGKPVSCEISNTEYGHILDLDTHGTALPCWLVANVVPDLQETIGANATFVGRLQAEPPAAPVNVGIQGVFADLDLSRSIRIANDPSARIELKECLLTGGELVEWDAELYQDDDSLPKRIDQQHLFLLSRKLDFAGALQKTWLDVPRTANRDADPKYN